MFKNFRRIEGEPDMIAKSSDEKSTAFIVPIVSDGRRGMPLILICLCRDLFSSLWLPGTADSKRPMSI